MGIAAVLSFGSSTASTKKNKCQISISTFEKWKQKYNSKHQSLSWLKCEADKNLITCLYCSACREYQGKICLMKNWCRYMGQTTSKQATCWTTLPQIGIREPHKYNTPWLLMPSRFFNLASPEKPNFSSSGLEKCLSRSLNHRYPC